MLPDTLAFSKFLVSTAANVSEPIHLIGTEAFDICTCPGRDGFTLISVMHHQDPNAITMLFTGDPAPKEAMDAFLLQVDEFLVKPMHLPELVDLIRARLDIRETKRPTRTERVAFILEHDALPTIARWLSAVRSDDELTSLQLSDGQLTGHLSQLIRELVHRLRVPRSLGTQQASEGVVKHGKTRYSQGWT